MHSPAPTTITSRTPPTHTLAGPIIPLAIKVNVITGILIGVGASFGVSVVILVRAVRRNLLLNLDPLVARTLEGRL